MVCRNGGTTSCVEAVVIIIICIVVVAVLCETISSHQEEAGHPQPPVHDSGLLRSAGAIVPLKQPHSSLFLPKLRSLGGLLTIPPGVIVGRGINEACKLPNPTRLEMH